VKEGLELGENEYASLIVGCIRTGSLQRGIAMLENMKEMGMHPSISTYNTLIDGFAGAAAGNFSPWTSYLDLEQLLGCGESNDYHAGCEIAHVLMDQMRQ
jgi:pentatricopeptide repeat protein